MKKLSKTALELLAVVAVGLVMAFETKFHIDTKTAVVCAVITIAAAAALTAVLKNLAKRAKMKRYRSSTLAQIDAMDGKAFEQYLQAVFYGAGYHARLTPDSNDFGADLVFVSGHIRVVVQAKRYQGAVGIAAVQQIIGARYYYDADVAMVITNSFYTPSAKKLAEAANVVLWDRNDLLMMTNDNISQKIQETISTYADAEKHKEKIAK